MAIRTDVDAVRAIADVDDSFIDADEDMDPFIEASNILVDWLVTKQTAASVAAYSSKQLRNIETWLAAHFYCIKDAQRVRVRMRVRLAPWSYPPKMVWWLRAWALV